MVVEGCSPATLRRVLILWSTPVCPLGVIPDDALVSSQSGREWRPGSPAGTDGDSNLQAGVAGLECSVGRRLLLVASAAANLAHVTRLNATKAVSRLRLLANTRG